MKYAPWAAALLLVAAIGAVGLVVLPGRAPRTSRPAELWGQLGRPLGVPAPAQEATPPAGAPAAVAPAQYILEQDSPIVSPDSTLDEALGIESPRGGFRAVLPRGTPVRYARSVMFRTGGDDQKEIRLHILRGRSEVASENRSLGWVRVSNLPPGPRGSASVVITFRIVDRSIVLVAQDGADGRTLPIQASEPPPGQDR